MKHTPILFSTPMVEAILEGRKTMTRRTLKKQPNENGVSFMKNPPLDWEQVYKEQWKPWKIETEEGESISLNCPYGQIGDVLWVRETWQPNSTPTGWPFHYKAKNDTFNQPENEKWKPSIFMPKAACRIFLEITDVRVERLQDITEHDAVAEGVEKVGNIFLWTYKNYLLKSSRYDRQYSALESFQTLWQSINGKDSWEANPFVWVVEFKRIEKPENFK